MTKQITTGTKITFKETGEKFILSQTETGFDVKQVKFSKNVQPEHWTFAELLQEYEAGRIAIDGFEETDAMLARQIINGYIHEKEISDLKIKIAGLETENVIFKSENENMKTENENLKTEISALNETIREKDADIESLKDSLEEENKIAEGDRVEQEEEISRQ